MAGLEITIGGVNVESYPSTGNDEVDFLLTKLSLLNII